MMPLATLDVPNLKDDLETLCRRGMSKVRLSEVPQLAAGSELIEFTQTPEAASGRPLWSFVMHAVDGLPTAWERQAAEALLGMIPGSENMTLTARRQIAGKYGHIAGETFRKTAEPHIIDTMARALAVLYRSSAASRAASDPAFASVARCTMPPVPSRLMGRSAELQRIAELAHSAGRPGGAVCCIDGMPGVGKTALALEAGHLLCEPTVDGSAKRDPFAERAYFLDLCAHTTGHQATPARDALASLLIADGVDPRYLPVTEQDRSTMWRTRLAGRPVVLVLDNAASSAQVAPLLPQSAGTMTLITSRRHLGDIAIANPAMLTLRELTSLEAKEMFLAGTIGRLPESEQDSRALEELLELAGHLPLAISLLTRVYVQHTAWTVADLLTETRARLLNIKAEHATIAAAFDLSYELLPATGRQLLRRLVLHPGIEFDRYAAAALSAATPEDAADGLADLHCENLLHEVGYGRYGMHDLIRTYLLRKVSRSAAQERRNALEALLDYYQQASETASSILEFRSQNDSPQHVNNGGEVAVPALRDRDEALLWLRTERSNLLACMEATDAPARRIDLTAALASVLRHDGPWAQGLELYSTAQRCAEELDDPHRAAVARCHRAELLTLMGHLTDAITEYSQAEKAFADARAKGQAVRGQARARFLNGQLAAAEQDWARALELHRQSHDAHGAASAMVGLGALFVRQNKSEEAILALREGGGMLHMLGDAQGESFSKTNLGAAYFRIGKLTDAIQALEQAQQLSQSIADFRGESDAITYLGPVWVMLGQTDRAIEGHQRAREICQVSGAILGATNHGMYLGAALLAKGELELAQPLLESALSEYQHAQLFTLVPHVSLYLAKLAKARGDYAQADDTLRSSLELFCSASDSGGEVEALNELADLCRLEGDLVQARAQHAQARDLATEIDSPWDLGHAHAGLGRCALAAGDVILARSELNKAIEAFDRMGPVAVAAEITREYEAIPTT